MFDVLTSGVVPEFSLLAIVFIVWALIWKGWALWIAARNKHKRWFIALLVINTIGILEIIYIFGFGKKELDSSVEEVAETIAE